MKKFINDNKTLLKRILNAVIFILFFGITLYIILSKNDIHEIILNINDADKKYILIAFGCMFTYIFLEGLNIHRMLTALGDKVSLNQTFKYSIVGFFFSSITPSSTGGQPMQLYFMSKDKVSISHGTLALLIQLLSFQFVTLLLAIIGFICNYDILLHHIGNIKYLMLFGLVINIAIQSFLFIMIFKQKMGNRLIEFFHRFLTKIHYKKSDSFYEKALVQLEEYHRCADYLKDNKKILILTVITTVFQMSIYHSVPYFIYRSFGLTEHNIFTFILMQAVLYISVASLPFPGSMGVSEGSFMIIFKMFFPTAILSSAMIISRGISFYLFVLISLILIMFYIMIDKVKKNRPPKTAQKVITKKPQKIIEN